MNEKLLKLVNDKLAHRTDSKSITIPKFGKFTVADLDVLTTCLRTGATKMNFAPPALVKLLAAIRGDE